MNVTNKKTPGRRQRWALGVRGCPSIVECEETLVHLFESRIVALLIDLSEQCRVQRRMRCFAIRTGPQFLVTHRVDHGFAVHGIARFFQDLFRGVEHAQLLGCGCLLCRLSARFGRWFIRGLGCSLFRRCFLCHCHISVGWNRALRSPMTACDDHQLPRCARAIQRHFAAVWKGFSKTMSSLDHDPKQPLAIRPQRPQDRPCCVGRVVPSGGRKARGDMRGVAVGTSVAMV